MHFIRKGTEPSAASGPYGFAVRPSGYTVVELMVTVAVIALVVGIGIPEYGRFVSKGRVRQAANDLLQEMRLTRTMAIKENRRYTLTIDPANQRYMVGFDQNEDGDLLDALDTYGVCNDGNGDRLPDTNPDADGDGVRDCVKVINLSDYGENVLGFGTQANFKTDDTALGASECNGRTACFGATTSPIRERFNPDGSVSFTGSVYFQHLADGYSYVAVVSNNSGSMSLWRWNGEAAPTPEAPPIQPSGPPHWREVR